MSAEIRTRLKSIEELLDRIRDATRHDAQKNRLLELEKEMSAPNFWDDREAAEGTIARMKKVKESVQGIENLATELGDALALFELAEADQDEDSLSEVEKDSKRLWSRAEGLELKTLMGGKYSAANAYIEVQSGAGGTDACDWTLMVQRMYLRWAEQQKFRTTIIDEQFAEEAGLKSSTIHIVGDFAYGYLQAESGVHRIVRISPFDAQARRQTAFASIRIIPETEASSTVDIAESDLRVDTYRASGAGGQHVNTTDSAVRITHIPSGIVVQCQNERSQHANRAQAMRVLNARILEAQERERREEMDRLQGTKSDIAFGSQIRSYILHPYKMVKDHRTSHETGNVDAVLDGDLQPFIESWLRHQIKANQSAE